MRLSGPQAGAALSRLAGALPPPRQARHRRLRDPDTGEILDDGLVLWFPGPRSATGEDVVELHLHGSRAVLAAIMAVLRGLGLRLAEPGEFTRRAFLNGKLDLVQAEAVADLAAAETEAQRRQALRQLDGALGGLYRGWSARLTRLLAHLEAAIDFPDEDLPPAIETEVQDGIAALMAEIAAHLADGHRGERLRDGIAVAIVGPPNAGKSSLLNRLARREAAITSPIAGTTRDVVEVAIDLAGYPVVLADTAGLRDSADVIEQEGLRRALVRADAAELRLFVFDASRPQDAAGAAAWPGPDTLLVANKIDLLCRAPGGGAAGRRAPFTPTPTLPRLRERGNACDRRNGSEQKDAFQSLANRRETLGGEADQNALPRKRGRVGVGATAMGPPAEAAAPMPGPSSGPFKVSALTGDGIADLTAALAARVAESYRSEAPVLTRARHREALEAALAALARALAAWLPELRAEDLRLAWRSLGHITGTVDVEDLLDLIFAEFCLGK
ncbi:MAG: tRNA uridine-5-carboxymethylaminomethyl(34) synthesis GTPase MnmE [Alphaproteobacteria bacterium]|nr:tRNA uridine-5-carboxymethylaminomethyl(34) synthesis GTPase MnmE [Alphaproteobacteria bacterium]